MIADFQKKNGLVPDGIIGKKTFKAFKDKYRLTDNQIINFLAQVHHESAGFTAKRENLNYSAIGLIRTFRYYRLRPHLAYKHSRNPELIANTIYADVNRSSKSKLGNTKPNDGWHFRGNASLQITGRNNHYLFSKYVNNQSIMTNPNKIWQQYYFDSAIWFFNENKLWRYANGLDYNSIVRLTKRINGGTNGLNHRLALIEKYKKLT